MADATPAAPAQTGTTPAAPTTPALTMDATPPAQAATTDWTQNPSLAKFGGDVSKLAEGYLNVEKWASGKTEIPKPESPQQVWDAYRKAIGVPEKVDGYQPTFPTPPDGQTLDRSVFDAMLPTFHQVGLTPVQVQALVDAYSKFEQIRGAHAISETESLTAEYRKELEKEYGGRLAVETNAVETALRTWFDAETREALHQVKYLPGVFRSLAKIGRLSVEAGYVPSETLAGGMPQDIQKRIDELSADPDMRNAFRNPPRHELLVKERLSLLRQLEQAQLK